MNPWKTSKRQPAGWVSVIVLLGFLLASVVTTPATARRPERFASTGAVGSLLTVDTLADENDGSCSDGDCSLRDAIQAADAGDNAACPPVDQLGTTRPKDGDGDGVPRCDIGAYELEPLPQPPGWRKSNISGFGQPENYHISALEVMGDYLYAGTWNSLGPAQLWRTPDGRTWSPITPTWSISNTDIYDLVPFAGLLYVGMGGGQGGEIWRGDGTSWEQVVAGGFGDENNYAISAMAEFSQSLYAATANLPPPFGSGNGVEVWRSASGDAGNWVQDNEDGFGGGPTWTDIAMDVYQGHLYLGLGRVTDGGTGALAELWRTDGLSWTAVFTDGLGDAGNSHVAAMAEFQGELYISMRNPDTGGQVWRSADGLSWTPVFTDGLGDVGRSRPYGLIAYDGRLVVVFSRPGLGSEVWQTTDGLHWYPIASGGWNNPNNMMAGYFDKPLAVFHGDLYIGTLNMADGGEVWRRLHAVFLPVVLQGAGGSH